MLVERFGRYVRLMDSGLKFKIPFIERITYHHSLKEQVLDVNSQTAITKGNPLF
jgi:regulator of protease activity HflC (stomatin/prohibitin superfamily)